MTDTPAPAPAPTPAPTPAPAPAAAPPASPAAAALGTPAPAAAPPAAAPPAAPIPGDPVPEWMRGLSPELQADRTLSRYGSVEDLAKGHLATREYARGRVALPSADDPASFAAFAEKARPESADAYEIAVPEGQATDMADAFRQTAFELGLMPHQAKAIAQFNNDFLAKQAQDVRGRNETAINALELEMGPTAWNRNLEAAESMLRNVGLDAAMTHGLVSALEQVGDGATAMKAIFKLAEATGELDKVDPAMTDLRMGNLTPDQAQAKLDAMSADKDIAAKLRANDPATMQQYNQLLAQAAKRQRA